MAHPVYAPRVNNNDDTVTIARLAVGMGDFVRSGDLILEVETDKAVVAVEAEQDGYVLRVCCADGEAVPVGAVALWMGEQADEPVPAAVPGPATEAGGETPAAAAVTGKARLLLAEHGLNAALIPRAGPRLTAADIEAYLAVNPRPAAGRRPDEAAAPGTETSPPAWGRDSLAPASLAAVRQETEVLPAAATQTPLAARERSVLATVTWQRDHAAAAYLELAYDPRHWQEHAAAFAAGRRLLLNPMLALMAHRLALLAQALDVNGTVLDDGPPRRVRYQHVNLGFTVQAGERLYLCVVEQAETMAPIDFVNRLGELQRRAMAHRLAQAEARGATVSLTSMARWGVHRHVPVLAPYTAVMVAHGSPSPGADHAVLGVTYDHRLLSGFDAVRLLRLLADPVGDLPERNA